MKFLMRLKKLHPNLNWQEIDMNEAVSIYNLFNKRHLQKTQLSKESKLTNIDSKEVLMEFEMLLDENKAI